jgi:hypothetical protein
MKQFGIFDKKMQTFIRLYESEQSNKYDLYYADRYVNMELIGPYPDAHYWTGEQMAYDYSYTEDAIEEELNKHKTIVITQLKAFRDNLQKNGIKYHYRGGVAELTGDDKAQFRIFVLIGEGEAYMNNKGTDDPEFAYEFLDKHGVNHIFTLNDFRLIKDQLWNMVKVTVNTANAHEQAILNCTSLFEVDNYDWSTGWEL